MKPSATISIEQVCLHKGDTLTIYANKGEPYKAGAIMQIELRVTRDGEIELFCDDKLSVRPFTEWQPQ